MKKKNDSSLIVERIVAAAKKYKQDIVGKTFLILFEGRCLEVMFKTDNFLHLCGVDTKLYAKDFYKKAVRGKLRPHEIGFSDEHPYDFADIKTKYLEDALSLLNNDALIITDVSTLSKTYKIGTTDLDVVLCFDSPHGNNGNAVSNILIPYSLRVESIPNEKFDRIFEVDFVLSKKTGVNKYSTMEFGNVEDLTAYVNSYGISAKYVIDVHSMFG